MNIFKNIENSIVNNGDRNAFVIGDNVYSYTGFALHVSRIRECLRQETRTDDKIIGLLAYDDIETYAAILALWFEGKSYVPLNPESPETWNQNIISQASLSIILSSSEEKLVGSCRIVKIKSHLQGKINLSPIACSDSDLAYMIFTSGTTGSPKGVPISRKNLAEFMLAFDALGFDVGSDDKCLQMFDLTFDVSIVSFLYPLLKGACIFTVPKGTIKYTYIYHLMEDYHLTFAMMVPSLLHYLRPYFEEIHFPHLKYNILTAEALPIDLIDDWSKCIPNSAIINLYGPTENTVFSTAYKLKPNKQNESYNGIVSIGSPLLNTHVVVIDENDVVVKKGVKGQLCICSPQLTPGYWNNPEKNFESFFYLDYQGSAQRFYRTGDICFVNENDEIMYSGRIDFQAKVQGFRVEVSEIEFHCKSYLKKVNSAALTFQNKVGNTEIGLVIESEHFDPVELITYLRDKIPEYMVPKEIRFENPLPLNSNGKLDRNKLKQNFSS